MERIYIVLCIIAMILMGIGQQMLSKEYDDVRATISRILSRVGWMTAAALFVKLLFFM